MRTFVGGVGEWNPNVPPTHLERALEAKLKEFDPNNNGSISLKQCGEFLRTIHCAVESKELSLIATSLHTEEGSAREVPIAAFVTRLRLFGLRTCTAEAYFWAAVDRALHNQNLDPQKMLRFLTVSPSGQIALADLVGWFTRLGLPVEEKVRPQVCRFLWPKDAEKVPAKEFEEYFTSRVSDARRLFIVDEVFVDTPTEKKVADHPAGVSEWREATLNRRIALIEMELQDKTRAYDEAKKQVGDLERLTLRLEADLHDQRRVASEVERKLADMVPASEVEPKLKRVEELSFELQQRRVELAQSKDLFTVCARQTENLERLIKRRQDENTHLQATVKLLQSKNDMELNVGRLQHRLLFSQWERGNAMHQYQAAVKELRRVRSEVFEAEQQYEDATKRHTEEGELLKQKIAQLTQELHALRQVASSNFTIEKAQELAAQVEDIAKSKTRLETHLRDLREDRALLISKLDEAKLESRHAVEQMEEMRRGPDAVAEDDIENPRKRLMDMGAKAADARLGELRQKRRADLALEQLTHNTTLLDEKEKQIELLQKKLTEAELKLEDQEELWREKVREAQELGSIGGFRTLPNGVAQGSAKEMLDTLNEKTTRVTTLEANLAQEQAEHTTILEKNGALIAQLQTKVKALMTSDGTGSMRQMLFEEHQKELREMSSAAKESVALLQEVIAQKDAQLARCESEIEELLAKLQRVQEECMTETHRLRSENGQLMAQQNLPRTPRSPTHSIKVKQIEGILHQKDDELAETSGEVERQREIASGLRKQLLQVQAALDEQMKIREETRGGRISQSLQRQLHLRERELSNLKKALGQMKAEVQEDERVTVGAKEREERYRNMADDLEQRMRSLQKCIQSEKDKNDRLTSQLGQHQEKEQTHKGTLAERDAEVKQLSALIEDLKKNSEEKQAKVRERDAQVQRLVLRANELEDEVTAYRRQKDVGDQEHAKASVLGMENAKLSEMMKTSEAEMKAKVEKLKKKVKDKGEKLSALEDENVRLRARRCHVCGAEPPVGSLPPSISVVAPLPGVAPISGVAPIPGAGVAPPIPGVPPFGGDELTAQTDVQAVELRALRDALAVSESRAAELRLQCERHQMRREKMEETHSALQDRYAAVVSSPTRTEHTDGALKGQVERLTGALERTREKYDKLLDEQEAMQSRGADPVLRQQITSLEEERAQLQRRMARSEEDLAASKEGGLMATLRQRDQDMDALREEVKRLTRAPVESSKAATVASLEEEIKRLAERIVREKESASDLEAMVRRKERDISTLEAEVNRLAKPKGKGADSSKLVAALRQKDRDITTLEAKLKERKAKAPAESDTRKDEVVKLETDMRNLTAQKAQEASDNAKLTTDARRKDQNIIALEAEIGRLTVSSPSRTSRDGSELVAALHQKDREISALEDEVKRLKPDAEGRHKEEVDPRKSEADAELRRKNQSITALEEEIKRLAQKLRGKGDKGLDSSKLAAALRQKDQEMATLAAKIKNLESKELEKRRSPEGVRATDGDGLALRRKDENIVALEAEVKQLAAQKARESSEIVNLTAELRRKDHSMVALEAEIKRLTMPSPRGSSSELATVVRQKDQELTALAEKIKNLTQSAGSRQDSAALEAEIKHVSALRAREASANDNYAAEVRRKDQTIAVLEAEIKHLGTQKATASDSEGIRRKEQQIASLEAEIRELQAQLSRLRAGDTSGSRGEATLQRKDEEIAALVSENKKLVDTSSGRSSSPCVSCTRLRLQLAEVEEIETQLRQRLAAQGVASSDLTDCVNCRASRMRIEELKLDMEQADKDKTRLVDQLHATVEDRRRARLEQEHSVPQGDDAARRRVLDLLHRVETLETENERLVQLKVAEGAPAERQAKMVEKITALQDEVERMSVVKEQLTTRNTFLEKDHGELLEGKKDQALLESKIQDLVVKVDLGAKKC